MAATVNLLESIPHALAQTAAAALAKLDEDCAANFLYLQEIVPEVRKVFSRSKPSRASSAAAQQSPSAAARTVLSSCNGSPNSADLGLALPKTPSHNKRRPTRAAAKATKAAKARAAKANDKENSQEDSPVMEAPSTRRTTRMSARLSVRNSVAGGEPVTATTKGKAGRKRVQMDRGDINSDATVEPSAPPADEMEDTVVDTTKGTAAGQDTDAATPKAGVANSSGSKKEVSPPKRSKMVAPQATPSAPPAEEEDATPVSKEASNKSGKIDGAAHDGFLPPSRPPTAFGAGTPPQQVASQAAEHCATPSTVVRNGQFVPRNGGKQALKMAETESARKGAVRDMVSKLNTQPGKPVAMDLSDDGTDGTAAVGKASASSAAPTAASAAAPQPQSAAQPPASASDKPSPSSSSDLDAYVQAGLDANTAAYLNAKKDVIRVAKAAGKRPPSHRGSPLKRSTTVTAASKSTAGTPSAAQSGASTSQNSPAVSDTFHTPAESHPSDNTGRRLTRSGSRRSTVVDASSDGKQTSQTSSRRSHASSGGGGSSSSSSSQEQTPVSAAGSSREVSPAASGAAGGTSPAADITVLDGPATEEDITVGNLVPDGHEETSATAGATAETSSSNQSQARTNNASNLVRGTTSFIKPKAPVVVDKRQPLSIKALQSAQEQREAEELKRRQREERKLQFKQRQEENKRRQAELQAEQERQQKREMERAAQMEAEKKAKQEELRRQREEKERQQEAERKQREEAQRQAAAERAAAEAALKQAEEEERARQAEEKLRQENEAKQKRLQDALRAFELKRKLLDEQQRLLDVKKKEEEQKRAETHAHELKLKEEAQRKAQLAIQKDAAASSADAADALAIAAVDVAPATPECKPEDNYDISSMHSGDSTDDEDKPRRPIPAWARGQALKTALYNQFLSTMDPSDIFPVLSPPNLTKIFDNKSKPRYKTRTSSARWEDSPRHPGTLRKLM